MSLCSHDAQQYSKQGFTALSVSIDSVHCAELCRALERWKRHANQNRYGILHHNLHLQLKIFDKLMQTYPLKAYAESVYGSPLMFFQDNLIWKPPRRASHGIKITRTGHSIPRKESPYGSHSTILRSKMVDWNIV